MASKPNLVGGCYVIVDSLAKYLPQVGTEIHTTVLDSICRTCLTQTFVNPSLDQVAREVEYVFPLDNGASVVGFTCFVGDRVIKGVVKEWREAQADFAKAKAQQKTAGLFQQSRKASDIFSTTIGNLPAGKEVRVELTYLGELKHDAEINGLRLTIPTGIAPRYGSAAWETRSRRVQQRGISVTVDVEMPSGSIIKSIQSPSHPMSVTIGTLSTAPPSSEPELRKASATFSQSSISLDIDVVIDVVTTNLGEPAAFLETHPTIPNQRALMATLVPKFGLAPIKPEIVFLCDRSGSMRAEMQNLTAALRIFLRSLPIGVKFNICSFGTKHNFLWEQSKTYNQDSFEEAEHHISSFDANYGGTNIFDPLEATFKRRYKDMNLEAFVLTDGRINDQDAVFNLIHTWVSKSNQDIRVFSLGVGLSVSSALVEGIARAGNGFAQTVHVSEAMDKKVVRMLKGALLPHIKDYSLEIKYGKVGQQDDDEFEIIEKVSDSLLVCSEGDEEWINVEILEVTEADHVDGKSNQPTEPSVDDKSIKPRHPRLPTIPTPDYIQVPSQISQVFPFSRTTAYVLLSNQKHGQEPKSVVLKGSCDQGPLELEIPIVHLSGKSSTIHQIAARKEIKSLEENSGWLSLAKDENGQLLREKFRPGFFNMAKREAVKLGVQFQVVGKWSSFVAVEPPGIRNLSGSEREVGEVNISRSPTVEPPVTREKSSMAARMQPRSSINWKVSKILGEEPTKTGYSAQVAQPSLNKRTRTASTRPAVLAPVRPQTIPSGREEDINSKPAQGASSKEIGAHPSHQELQKLIALQGFGGSWAWSADLEVITKVTYDLLSKLNLPVSVFDHENRSPILATICAIAFLNKHFIDEKEIWDLIESKGHDWLNKQIGSDLEELVQKISELV